MTQKKILVIGAGAWGTAIANLVSNGSSETILTSSHQQVVDEINHHHTNQKSLPGIVLSQNLVAKKDFLATATAKEIRRFEFVFIVTPSSKTVAIFNQIAALKFSRNCGFVICSKGFAELLGSRSSSSASNTQLSLLSDAFEQITGIKNYAVLSGPNFASEVAQGLPTVTTIATKKKKLFDKISAVLNGENFCCVFSKFPRSAEICGIVKNVIAIGCGIVDELGLGMNAKAALVVKGCNEIQLLCDYFKTSNDLENPHGFGDIFLTCSSEKSRNYSLGKLLAQEKTYEEIARETCKTYEGFSSAKDLAIFSKTCGIKLELSSTINEILSQKFSRAKISQKIIATIL